MSAYVRSRSLILSCIVAFFLFVLIIPRYGGQVDFSAVTSELAPAMSLHKPSFANLIQRLYAPLVLPVTAPTFTNVNGTVFKMGREPIWKKSLKNQIVIADVDTRALEGYNNLFEDKPLEWSKLGEEGQMDPVIGKLSAGALSHYLYAQIHGYDYRYFKAAPVPGLGGTWAKVHAMRQLLKEYRFVIFIDRDAFFNHMEVPIEWLLNRWNVTEETSLSIPLDVLFRTGNATLDSQGKRIQNNGFIVAQANERTNEILDAWATCWDDKRYPGCSHWKNVWGHEQSAMAEYIRYDFNRETDIKEISCEDANGYPEKGRYIASNCNGDFIRHYWVRKHFAKPAMANSILQSVAVLVQSQMLQEREHILYTEENAPSYELDDDE